MQVLPRWTRGPLLTLAVLAIVELLARAGFRIAVPAAFYAVAIVYAGYEGGARSGLVSAGLALLYGAYFLASPGPGLSLAHATTSPGLVNQRAGP